MTTTTMPAQLSVGSKVHLRGARFDQPGTVVKMGKRLTVYWRDLDFLSKHQPESLILAREQQASDTQGACTSMEAHRREA